MSGSVITQLVVAGKELRALSWRGEEKLHTPSRFVVECAAFHPNGEPFVEDPHSLLTESARIAWDVGGDQKRDKQKLVVDEVETDEGRFFLTLVSEVGLLADTCEHRIFVDRDVLFIAKAILTPHAVTVKPRIDRTLPKRPQSIQQFESELGYVSRLLAEEGITWFELDDGELVFSDDEGGFDTLPGSIPVRERSGLESEPSVFEARLRRGMTTDAVALRDYDFERPLLPLDVDTGEGSRRVYEFPGGYVDPLVGKDLAAIRLGERSREGHVLTGATTVRTFRPGAIVELADDGAGSPSGRWLVVSVVHRAKEAAGGELSFVTRFEAVPAENGFRPPRIAPPKLGGVHTAVVTGAAGGEIHTEEHARIRLHHRWDRKNARDDKSSQWSRVMQPQTSGSIFLPRVGWEVLVGFAGRERDEPVVVGQLHNGAAPPPFTLPAKKVVSSYGTQSTPKGDKGHLLEIDDSAGAEALRMKSTKDFIEKVEKDKATEVTVDDEWEVGTRTFTVGKVFQRSVTGDQDHNVIGLRDSTVGSNFGFSASSQLAVVLGLRTIQTGGDLSNKSANWLRFVVGAEGQACVEHYNRFVHGGSVVLNRSSWSTVAGFGSTTAIGGASALRVGGPKSVKCSNYLGSTVGIISEKYASRSVDAGSTYHDKLTIGGKYEFSGDASFKGTNVTFEATTKLTVKAGGVTITLTPGKIVVSGKYVSSVSSAEASNSKFG